LVPVQNLRPDFVNTVSHETDLKDSSDANPLKNWESGFVNTVSQETTPKNISAEVFLSKVTVTNAFISCSSPVTI